MYVLVVDVETTGLEVGDAHIIEVGAVLWDILRKKPVNLLSETVESNHDITPEITKLTGITQEMVEPPIATPIAQIFHHVARLAENAKYYVAHNAAFDKGFLEYAAMHFEIPWVELPWIDTMRDLPLPENLATRKLTYLALEHGILMDYAHRAVFDCIGTARLLSCYDFDEVERIATSPVVRIEGKQKFQDNQLAKDAGFRWDGDQKKWIKLVPQFQVEEFTKTLTFPWKNAGNVPKY